MPSIACFVSSHGFGHAARASAVMAAIQTRSPETHFEVFTQSPEWLFRDSLLGRFTYHNLACDVGVVQRSPLEEDLPATLERLAAFLPFDNALIDSLAEKLTALDCRMVICDISPLGIAAARRAGVPSILIENFTWDWIYAGYLDAEPRFAPYIAALSDLFRSADYHIQTEPVCQRVAWAALVTPPICRQPRLPAQETRRRLGIPPDARVALFTMGGIQSTLALTQHSSMPPNLYFVIPGAKAGGARIPRCIPLPFHSDFYHPDLVAASDVVIGKAGYSTLAEAYLANVPFVFIARPRFRETPSLVRFILEELGGFEIPEAGFQDGSWLQFLPHLLEEPRRSLLRQNGAELAAEFILNLYSSS